MRAPNNFETVLKALTKFKVEFMLAGGYAVNFHGYNRTTSDLDIWVKPAEENKKRIFDSLLSLGFSKEMSEQVDKLDFSKPFCFSIGTEPVSIDIFNHMTGVNYAEAEKNMIPFKFSDSVSVHYIHLTDLVKNKMLTNRLKDKADVEELQKINIAKNKK